MSSAQSVFILCIILSLGHAAPSADNSWWSSWWWSPLSTRVAKSPTYEENNLIPGRSSHWIPIIYGLKLTQSHGDIYVPPNIDAMTSDARMWYTTGIDNAERGISKFDEIVDGLRKNKNIDNLLKPELKELLNQVTDANENTKSMVPAFVGFVSEMYEITRDLGFFGKMKLRVAITAVHKLRDNKSYYLLNGAAQWSKLRANRIAAVKTKRAVALLEDLNQFIDQTLTARDTLDEAAQIYVKAMDECSAEVTKMYPDWDKVHEVVTILHQELQKRQGLILQAAQRPVDTIESKINALN